MELVVEAEAYFAHGNIGEEMWKGFCLMRNPLPSLCRSIAECGGRDENGEKESAGRDGFDGVGKSRLAIDLAEHFAGVEIINADSMQVYRGLDILTNKVPLCERKGVPHHLLGTIDASMEFTSKDFRDIAIPIIDDILSRGCLPVIVGGTNYYIQALVSPYLVDDVVEDMAEGSGNSLLGDIDLNSISSSSAFELLKEIDPIAANRIHPNDHRKASRRLHFPVKGKNQEAAYPPTHQRRARLVFFCFPPLGVLISEPRFATRAATGFHPTTPTRLHRQFSDLP
ncbi:hypothetical protein KFK09_023157 [Dendrobium nobile]|uniref:Uncharacterized protein n=1 Tax=Dendrobium nobile TaxID=94219 RepID=A0A8T3AKR1_DENNO|nr:hypothetical protein KFK09_023157 [Dendrobium nobile]